MIGKLECPCCDNGEMRPLTEDEKIDILIDMLVGEEDETKVSEGVERESKVASPIVSEGVSSNPPTHTSDETAKAGSDSVVEEVDSRGESVADEPTAAVEAESREDAVDNSKPLPFANAKTCPECGGLLEPLTEAEREAVLKEFEADKADCPCESEKAVVEPSMAVSDNSAEEDEDDGQACLNVDNDEGVAEDTGKLLFIDRDGIMLADTRGLYSWDGKKETMPSDWVGKGYFVITNEGRVRCGVESRMVVNGCLAYGLSYYNISYRDTRKTMVTPIIFKDRDSAREVLRLYIQQHNSKGYYWQKLVDPDTIKRVVEGDPDLGEVLHRVIPIEEYAPRMRGDVINEIRGKSPTFKRVKSSSAKDESASLVDLDRLPDSEEMARRQDAFLKEVSERKRNDPFRRLTTSRGDSYRGIDNDIGTPLTSTKMIADWSKVDWDEEDRESDELERQQLGLNHGWGRNEWETCTQNVRRAHVGLKTVKTNDRWLLADWNTGKFVKIENGQAILVPREDCTFFEKLSDANNIAIQIEREFWNPTYLQWRLHVVPYTESEKEKGNGAYNNKSLDS